MSSIRRILSSRANGARALGPGTLEGKQRSSLNALAHGLLARRTLMQGESPEALQALLNQHLERLEPAEGITAPCKACSCCASPDQTNLVPFPNTPLSRVGCGVGRQACNAGGPAGRAAFSPPTVYYTPQAGRPDVNRGTHKESENQPRQALRVV